MSKMMISAVTGGAKTADNLDALAGMVMFVRFAIDAMAQNEEPMPEDAAYGLACCLDLIASDLRTAGEG